MDVEFFGNGLGRQIVGLGGRQQHGLGLGQLVSFKYSAVGLEVLEQLVSGYFTAVDLLQRQIWRECALDEFLDIGLELLLDIWKESSVKLASRMTEAALEGSNKLTFQLSVEFGTRANSQTRMWHQKAVESLEALFQVQSQILELAVLLVFDLEASLQQVATTLVTVLRLVRETPITDQERQLLLESKQCLLRTLFVHRRKSRARRVMFT